MAAGRPRADCRGRGGHGSADARALEARPGGHCDRARRAPARVLRRNLAAGPAGGSRPGAHGFFDELPLADDSADLVVACSAFTRDAGHGGEAGLAEMERVCRPGGSVASSGRTTSAGYPPVGIATRASPGEMFVEFASREEAVELTAIFYPGALSRFAGMTEGGSRSTCSGSTRRAISPTRCCRDETRPHRPARRPDPRATAGRLTGFHLRPRPRPDRPRSPR